jgi:hypothetical protein
LTFFAAVADVGVRGATAAELIAAFADAAAAEGEIAGPETAASAGFGDCFEHAVSMSSTARSEKLAIIANFCWRDQEVSEDPEKLLLVTGALDFLSRESSDLFGFQVVVILSSPLRLTQSGVISQESHQVQHR